MYLGLRNRRSMTREMNRLTKNEQIWSTLYRILSCRCQEVSIKKKTLISPSIPSKDNNHVDFFDPIIFTSIFAYASSRCLEVDRDRPKFWMDFYENDENHQNATKSKHGHERTFINSSAVAISAINSSHIQHPLDFSSAQTRLIKVVSWSYFGPIFLSQNTKKKWKSCRMILTNTSFLDTDASKVYA